LRDRRVVAGFTVVEVLVVVLLIGIIAVMAMESLAVYVPRVRLRGTASQVAQLILKARLQAIQSSGTAVLTPDEGAGGGAAPYLMAHLDLDGDLTFDPGVEDLIGRVPLAAGISYGGFAGAGSPDDQKTVGLIPVAGLGLPVLPVEEDGSMRILPGSSFAALRFTDGTGLNVMEVRVTSFAGKIEVRKYLLTADTSGNPEGFYEEGTFDDSWPWYRP
jgi:type II secretory pathway pseudopilin PulG